MNCCVQQRILSLHLLTHSQYTSFIVNFRCLVLIPQVTVVNSQFIYCIYICIIFLVEICSAVSGDSFVYMDCSSDGSCHWAEGNENVDRGASCYYNSSKLLVCHYLTSKSIMLLLHIIVTHLLPMNYM